VKAFIDFISQPWLGTVLGIVGLTAAIFFYLRSRRITRLAYQHDEVTLLGGSDAAFPEEIDIRFAGSSVLRVTATRIVFWNAGNTTIESAQIVANDKLRIELEDGGTVLKVNTLKVARKVNGISLAPSAESNRTLVMSFDYLDPGDGIAFEVLHSAGRGALHFHGTLRGLPGGVTNYGTAIWFSERRRRRFPLPFTTSPRAPLVVISVIGLAIMAYGLIRPQIYAWFPKLHETPKPADPTALCGLWLSVVAFTLRCLSLSSGSFAGVTHLV
jgi:hypothetical protein